MSANAGGAQAPITPS